MELLRRLVLLPFAAAASVSLRNTAALERGANSSFAGKGKFDISQLSTAFDDGESLVSLRPAAAPGAAPSHKPTLPRAPRRSHPTGSRR